MTSVERMMDMGILAKDLARQLNISPATVSMVLNNKPGISEETRDLVLAAARENGYQFKKRSEVEVVQRTIHFIIYKKHGDVVADTPFFSQLIEGITQKCRQENCMLQISYFYEQEDIQQQLADIRTANNSGILLLGTEMDLESFRYFAGFKAPIVLLDCYHDELNVDSVLINNMQGAYLATNFLAEKGHKTIGYLQSKVRINNFQERADGYYKALRAHKIPTDHPHVIKLSPSTDAGYHDMLNWLDKNPPIADAYFADNDILGAIAIRAFQERGYRIPQDISIIGFDDMPVFQFLEPSLSTMRVQKKELGALAVARLMEKMRGGGGEITKIALSTHLVERESTNCNK